MLDIILELFSVLGLYYFVLIAFAFIMTSLGFLRLSEIASTIALIVALVLSIIIIKFLSSKRNKFLQENKER
jgi:Sec-independent protein secretion pathway component TatC